jgi:hypothetical protein
MINPEEQINIPHKKNSEINYRILIQYINPKWFVVYILHYLRMFYLQLYTINCEICGHRFFYVYLSLDLLRCEECSQEYCKYCIEIKSNDNNHGIGYIFGISRNKQKCLYRYTILYIAGLIGFLILYLKFIFVCNSNFITKYLTATFFLLEYVIFSNKVDNVITTFLSLKNITLGLILLLYYDEKDILIYLIVGMIQLIFILLINMMKDIIGNIKIREIITLIKSE